MKLSSARWLVDAGIVVLAVVTLSAVRAPAADAHASAKRTEDAFSLPSPEQSLVFSLGYRSALADVVYAHVLVSYGLHFQEKRRFEHLGKYLDLVTTLDPKFAQPYLYSDTLLTLQAEPPLPEDYKKARELLLRGTRELAHHQELWFSAGQYLAYIAPGRVKSASLKAEYRREGAQLLARACELATHNQSIPHHCLAAASLLNRAGEREALIQMLTKTLAVNDDPEVRAAALAALEKWGDQKRRHELELRSKRFNQAWSTDLQYVSRELLLLLGPAVPLADCLESTCVSSWDQFFSSRSFSGNNSPRKLGQKQSRFRKPD